MSTGSVPDSARSLGRGTVAGLGAWLVGYLVTYLLHSGGVRDALATDVLELLAGDPVTWKLIGWLYFNAHFVDASVPGLLGRSTVNLLSGAEELGLLALYVLPPVALLVAGAVAAYGRADADAGAVEGAKTGAAVALGYLLASLVGAVAVRITVADAVAGPSLVTAVLLAGLVYPLVFGAVGGAVATVVAGPE